MLRMSEEAKRLRGRIAGGWVTPIAQPNYVGLIVGRSRRKAEVKFGPDGPYKRYWLTELQPATEAQIAEVTGQ
jgi:hypothetical protein